MSVKRRTKRRMSRSGSIRKQDLGKFLIPKYSNADFVGESGKAEEKNLEQETFSKHIIDSLIQPLYVVDAND
jgi:hypothetical protein